MNYANYYQHCDWVCIISNTFKNISYCFLFTVGNIITDFESNILTVIVVYGIEYHRIKLRND